MGICISNCLHVLTCSSSKSLWPYALPKKSYDRLATNFGVTGYHLVRGSDSDLDYPRARHDTYGHHRLQLRILRNVKPTVNVSWYTRQVCFVTS